MGFFSFRRQKESTDDSVFESRAAEDAATARGRSRKRKTENEPIDPVLPEKQRARRRLLGAVALVMAAVIGLPMILDPEPKPLADDISIDIPSKDKTRQGASARPAGATLPASASLDKREEILVPAAATAGAAAAAAGTAATDLPPAPKAEAGADNKPDAKDKKDTKDVKVQAVPAKPDAQLNSKAEAAARPAVKPDAKSADDARARALLDGKADPVLQKVKPGAESSERYVVQVAALASADKVHELQNKLKAAGIKSHTQKVATQSGERIRVRVGPVQGKAEAEKVRAKLNKLGLNGTLVPA